MSDTADARLYPLKMRPFYRHGAQTPWGGDMLRTAFGKDTPDDMTGESLEISALPGMESAILNGALAGRTLGDALALWGDALTGRGVDGFPLLIKLIGARAMLSVQVHPGDAYAQMIEGKLGKSEAWVVLEAPRGARIVYGLDPGATPLGEYIAEGRLEDALRWVPVAPGDVVYIPNGMVHALGRDILVYEVQQSSDVTYRFWDWGRVDADGKPRALHTRKALDVARADLRLDKIEGATVLLEGGSATAYISDDHFELARLNVSGDMPLPTGRMLLLTALGDCELRWDGGECTLRAGESAVVPAGMAGARLRGTLSVLCATTPDRGAVLDALGDRAEAVAGLT